MTDRENVSDNFGRLKNLYVGTGDVNTTRQEFGENIYRDSLASIICHRSRLLYLSLGLQQSPHQTRLDLLEKMVKPCKK